MNLNTTRDIHRKEECKPIIWLSFDVFVICIFNSVSYTHVISDMLSRDSALVRVCMDCTLSLSQKIICNHQAMNVTLIVLAPIVCAIHANQIHTMYIW